MPAKRTKAPPRAKRGTVTDGILVGLDATLSRAVRLAAAAEGCTLVEWMRRAAHERALRQAAENPVLRARMLGGDQ